MKVKRIYSRDVIRAPRSFSLEQVAVLMRQHHVGAVLVTEDEPSDNQAIGIVTDRDLVLQAIAEGIGPREATIADVMTPSIASVSENADIFEALETMRAKGVRRLAVSAGRGAGRHRLNGRYCRCTWSRAYQPRRCDPQRART